MSQRTSTYADTLLDASSNPITGQTIYATLLVPGGGNAIDGNGNVIAKKILTAVTDGSGTYSFTLDYAGDLTTTNCTYQFNELGTLTLAPLGYSYASSYTVSSWYGAAPASGTIEMQVTLEDASEVAVTNRNARVYLSQNGVDTVSGVIYSTSVPIKQPFDGSGLASFYLTPTANINPSGTYYKLVIDNEPTVFTFTVPASGGPYAITAYLTAPATANSVQLSPTNILHDSGLSAPPSGAPHGSPVTLADDLENLQFTATMDATTTTTGVMEIDAAPISGHPIAVTVVSKGATNGVASLDATTHIPQAQVPLIDPGQVGAVDQALLSDGNEALWAKQTGIAMFPDPTTADNQLVGRVATSVSTLVIGFIGDDLSLDTYNVPADVITNISGGGLTITKNNQAVTGTKSGDWLHTGSNYSTAVAAFAGAGVRIVHVMLGTNDSRVSVATTQATFGSNLQDLCQHLVKDGFLVVVSQPPSVVSGSSSGDFNGTSNTLLYEYGVEVNRVVNGYNIIQGDTMAFQMFAAHTAWFSDGFHPGSTGQTNLAALWSTPLKRLAQAVGYQQTLRPITLGPGLALSGTVLQSPFSWATKTANYTATTVDSGILVDATSGNLTVTLPTAVGNVQRISVKKKDSSGHTVTIATTSAQTIDGASTVVISTQYADKTVGSDGSNWFII